MGYASHCCSNGACPHRKKVCFSCKSRFCPTCGKKTTDQWTATQTARLPQTRWQHITLTMPSALWEVFRLNRALQKAPNRLAEVGAQIVCGAKQLADAAFSVADANAAHRVVEKLSRLTHILQPAQAFLFLNRYARGIDMTQKLGSRTACAAAADPRRSFRSQGRLFQIARPNASGLGDFQSRSASLLIRIVPCTSRALEL
ncbi:hypothetical protein QFZ96_002281 [Paraburkholderia youngii]